MCRLNGFVRSGRLLCSLVVLVVLGLVGPVHAQQLLTIPAGLDAWQAGCDGCGGFVNFGGTTELPELPAGFFGPGSDPFSGQVDLGGDPLFPDGNLDTLIQRLDPADLDGPPVAFDTVPIEIVELSLVSVQPINVTFGGGNDQLWDVHVSLDPGGQTPGLMTINKNIDPTNGAGDALGTFNSILPVVPQLVFTRVDQVGLTNPVLGIGGDGVLNLMQTSDPFTQFWTEAVPPAPFAPDPFVFGNLFFPVPGLFYTLAGDGFSLTMVPAEMPEPATGVITLVALMGLSGRRLRRVV